MAVCMLLIASAAYAYWDPGAVMRFRTVTSGSGRAYDYWKFSTVGGENGGYQIQSGDYLEYAVYVQTDTAGIGGIDIMFKDGNWLRQFACTDQFGLAVHPATDIRPQAYRKWVLRHIPLNLVVGKRVDHWDVAVDSNDFGWWNVGAAMYATVSIKNSANQVMVAPSTGAIQMGLRDFAAYGPIYRTDLFSTSPRRGPAQVGTHFFFWTYVNQTDNLIYKPHGLFQTTNWTVAKGAEAWDGYGAGYPFSSAGYYYSMNQAWWEQEFQDMKRAGIDFASICYWGDYPDASFCTSTLSTYMVPALHNSGTGIRVACFDDTHSECSEWNSANGRPYGVPDETPGTLTMPLSDSANWARFYDCKIKRWFQAIPQDLWATHNGLSVAQGGRPLIIIFCTGTNTDPSKNWYGSLPTYAGQMWRAIKSDFARDFGVTPFLLFHHTWIDETAATDPVPADGNYRWNAGSAYTDGYAQVRKAANYYTCEIEPQLDTETNHNQQYHNPFNPAYYIPRTSGSYLQNWFSQSLNVNLSPTETIPPWNCNLILEETWNEEAEGSSICRALTYTDSDDFAAQGTDRPGNVYPETIYMDLFGQRCIDSSIGRNDWDATVLQTWKIHTSGSQGILRRGYGVPVTVRNDGLRPWNPSPASTDLNCTNPIKVGMWLEDAAGNRVGTETRAAALPSTITTGQQVTVNFTVPNDWYVSGQENTIRYLRVGVLAEGEFWFTSKGDTMTKLPVKVQL